MAEHLVIGMGEIGSAVATVLASRGVVVDTKDVIDTAPEKTYTHLHICIPFSDDFVKIVTAYQKQFRAECTIIYSTVKVGTTKQIPKAVHSPIEGRHPRLYFGVERFKRYIGYNDVATLKLAEAVWKGITTVLPVDNSDHTEFLKLASTSKYAINVVWAQYMADTAEELGMDYKLVKDWDRAYNGLYKRMNLGWARKFVLDPPNGRIGGHCLVPNAELLDDQFPHGMLKMIKEMK